MSDIVFILGAGASRDAGGPLMTDFLDKARDLWEGNEKISRDKFELVFNGLSQLRHVHSKANLDLNNLEAVFAAFEMAGTIQHLADLASDEVAGLENAMRTVIVETLEHNVRFTSSGSTLKPSNTYGVFVRLLRALDAAKPSPRTVAVISFNYDVALDFALHDSGYWCDYALGNETSAGKPIPVLKLHGSLNWGRCSRCADVFPWMMNDYLSRYSPQPPYADGTLMRLNIGNRIGKHKHTCGSTAEPTPVIVPPTWNKSRYADSIRTVWARASQELLEAQSIVIIGYSLPPSDEFFRSFYALSTVGETLLRRFVVINPDEDGSVQPRYRELLGPGALGRFKFLGQPFENTIGLMADEFGVQL